MMTTTVKTSLKIEFASLQLYRVYLDLLNLSKVGNFSGN